MPGQPSDSAYAFSYVILRLVPSIERGEQVNVGVVVFCRQLRFLGARMHVDAARVAALQTDRDAGPAASSEAAGRPLSGPELAEHLAALMRVVEGDPAAGPIAALPASERFGWLAAPSSTIVQPSQVHTGLCEDAEATLDALFARLVA